jgi:hypothetical protein
MNFFPHPRSLARSVVKHTILPINPKPPFNAPFRLLTSLLPALSRLSFIMADESFLICHACAPLISYCYTTSLSSAYICAYAYNPICSFSSSSLPFCKYISKARLTRFLSCLLLLRWRRIIAKKKKVRGRDCNFSHSTTQLLSAKKTHE